MPANENLRRIAGMEMADGRLPVRPLREIEREAIETAISYCQGSIPRAAKLLQVAPSTIYRKQAAWAGLASD